jgi:hypothetical protein
MSPVNAFTILYVFWSAKWAKTRLRSFLLIVTSFEVILEN